MTDFLQPTACNTLLRIKNSNNFGIKWNIDLNNSNCKIIPVKFLFWKRKMCFMFLYGLIFQWAAHVSVVCTYYLMNAVKRAMLLLLNIWRGCFCFLTLKSLLLNQPLLGPMDMQQKWRTGPASTEQLSPQLTQSTGSTNRPSTPTLSMLRYIKGKKDPFTFKCGESARILNPKMNSCFHDWWI